jgi:hypothetical protein
MMGRLRGWAVRVNTVEHLGQRGDIVKETYINLSEIGHMCLFRVKGNSLNAKLLEIALIS